MGDVLPRIVIIDDDPAFLATVRLLLEEEGFVVAGEALNGLDGVAAATDLAPDIVLVDVNLPDIDGFEVVERLAGDKRAHRPSCSPRSVPRTTSATSMERSRARGFITKADITGEALIGSSKGGPLRHEQPAGCRHGSGRRAPAHGYRLGGRAQARRVLSAAIFINRAAVETSD